MKKKVGISTYIQRINTLERKLLKQVKELGDVMEKHPEIMFRLQVVEFAFKHPVKVAVEAFDVSKSTIYRWIKNYKNSNNNPVSLKNRYVSKKGMKLEKLQKNNRKT
jgi:transposase-like protein